MALLRVELHAGDVSADDGRGEIAAVAASSQRIRGGFAYYPKRVHEIETSLVRKLARQRMIRNRPANRVPAHVRNPQSVDAGESLGVRADQPEAGHAAFLAAEGQHLHPDANAQHRPLHCGEFQYRCPQTRSVEGVHARIERTDSRQNEALRIQQRFLIRDDFRFYAKLAEHIAYRSGIADTVVDDPYFGHGARPAAGSRPPRERSLTKPAEAEASKGMNTNPPERNAVNAEVTCNWNKPYMQLPSRATHSGVFPRLMMKISKVFTTKPTSKDMTSTPP